MHASRLSSGDISSEVLRVVLGVFLPPRALVVHQVLQAVPLFVIGGAKARVGVPRAPVLVQVLESGQVPKHGCAVARVRTPRRFVLSRPQVVLSRPLQQSYTPPESSEVAYVFRSFTKKSDDSLVGQRQSFVVVQPAYDTRNPRLFIHVREPAPVEPERVRSGSHGGVLPRVAHPSEVVAGLDALHVGEHHGRDIQAGIEGGTVRIIELTFVVLGRHGEAVRAGGSERTRASSPPTCLVTVG